MTTKIRKAVLPVAGLGTRFLPATKAVPKEMLTVVDRPIIQYVVDEAYEAGIEHIVFVTGRNKQVIEDHFDIAFELEETLRKREKDTALQLLKEIRPQPGTTSFTRQQEPLGLGHAIGCARDLIGNEPFAVLLPDVLIKAKPGCLSQMLKAYENKGGNVIAVEEVATEQTDQYGVVEVEEGTDDIFTIKNMIEKPRIGAAPSNLIITGRYILQPEIFDLLSRKRVGAGGEIQLTDAMLSLIKTQRFTGVKYSGTTFDCGNKIGFLSANVAFALDRDDLVADARAAFGKILNMPTS